MSAKRQDAPGELEHVRKFVNTLDLEGGSDELDTPDALVGWLAQRGLLSPDAGASDGDLARAQEVREALRSRLLANNGEPSDPGATATLRDAARRARVALTFDQDRSHLAPQAGGVDGAIGRLLTIVHRAEHDGTWERLKACRWHTCNWAFYDHTKNHSGVWCTMDVCGNRAKAKAFRERRSTPGVRSRARAGR